MNARPLQVKANKWQKPRYRLKPHACSQTACRMSRSIMTSQVA